MSDQNTKNRIITWWLERGFSLLPCQSNSKFLLGGFGPHQSKVTSQKYAERLFNGHLNMAVFAPPSKLILDFDDIEVYRTWCNEHPEIEKTYTERTPRGGAHVYLTCKSPNGIQLVQGVELKNVCVVAPSIVNDKAYTRGEGEILEADAVKVFSSLSKVGTRSAYVLGIEQRQQAKRERMPYGSKSIIEQIKQQVSIEHVFTTYRPDANIEGKARYVMVRCPFHDDKKPSMYLDRELNIFKCHACGVHGDVINLYAMFQGIAVGEAIARLSRSVGRNGA